jgi:hypothetical protein
MEPMNKREIKSFLRSAKESADGDYLSLSDDGTAISSHVLLGSFLSLDPCGKYHHILSPNGITTRCERFWENLEDCANELNAWTETGEGNALDIFLVWPYAEDLEQLTIHDREMALYTDVWTDPNGRVFAYDAYGELREYLNIYDYTIGEPK